MDGVTLLAEARAAGFRVSVGEAGDRLVIRGPLRLESLAQRLIAAKSEVLAALRHERDPVTSPLWPCSMCNGHVFWRYAQGRFVCETCHPCPCREHMAEQITVATGLPPQLSTLLEKFGWDSTPPIRWPQTLQRPARTGGIDEDDFDDCDGL